MSLSYKHLYPELTYFQGTGLFLGTASDLENGGPAGLLIGYCVMASLLYSVMVSTSDRFMHNSS